jgi:hypothetical protein
MVKTVRVNMHMMRTTLLLKGLILGFLAALSISSATVQAQYTEDGKPFILVSPIIIISPSNKTYNPQFLTLNITFRNFLDSSRADITVVYSIDGKTNATISTESKPVPMGIQSYYVINGSATLPEMPEGTHYITVYGKYDFPMVYHNIAYDNRTVYFTIDDGNPPIISDLSVENRTYSQDNLTLNFTLDEPASWTGYCLDDKANVTLTEDFTLNESLPGSHTLAFYANDTVGNMGRSETVYFTTTRPFPTMPVLAGTVVAVVLLSASLLLYYKKHEK